MEYLDLLDEYGNPSGKTKERAAVHRDGNLHRTVHIWIARRSQETGRIQILMQKRSDQKDSYPGCYDISAAGHVPAGEGYLAAARRELLEELGIEASESDLEFLFFHKGYAENFFCGSPFRNYEYSAVYLYRKPVTAETLLLQKEEVSAVCWMNYGDVLLKVLGDAPEFCVFPDEFTRLEACLNQAELFSY